MQAGGVKCIKILESICTFAKWDAHDFLLLEIRNGKRDNKLKYGRISQDPYIKKGRIKFAYVNKGKMGINVYKKVNL